MARLRCVSRLGLAPDPDFEWEMLPGWGRRSPDEIDQAQLSQALKSRFTQMQRPDLYASGGRMLTEAYDSMSSRGDCVLRTHLSRR